MSLNKILDNFEKVKVLVVGDVMLDRYWFGNVNRISPEAPVPIVNLQQEKLIAGGAANVAANVKSLGATPYLLGIIGGDTDGQLLKQVVEESSISSDYLIAVSGRPTTVKTRIVAHNQQIARIDNETTQNLQNVDEDLVLAKIKNLLNLIDVVIVSDYNKGLLSENLLKCLITLVKSQNKKILVDPKGKNYQKYRDATLLTPNQKEASEASNIENIIGAGEKLLNELNLESILITQGEAGMTIFERDGKHNHFKALARHVYDVTGAGDTVIATLGVTLAAGGDLLLATEIANIAAGFVVEELGTTTIDFNKLKNSLEN